MLTQAQKSKLAHASYIAPQLQYFCQKWSTSDECPAHFEDMMIRFLDMGFKEQMNFYIIDDILYTVDQYVKTNYRLNNPGKQKYTGETEWTISTSKSRY